jgi:hypothetical protein
MGDSMNLHESKELFKDATIAGKIQWFNHNKL